MRLSEGQSSTPAPSAPTAPGLMGPMGGLRVEPAIDAAGHVDLARCGPGASPLERELERMHHELYMAHRYIAELKRSQQEMSRAIVHLTHIASTDVLTGLDNRRRFGEELETAYALAIRQGLPLSVVMIDVDHFKAYNDTYGHMAGDAVLCALADCLTAGSRPYDVVARYGGEEFAVLLPATGGPEAIDCAERLRRIIAAHAWPLRPVRASFGVATLGPDTPNAAALVNEADRALYRSKARGRDCVTHFRQLGAGIPVT